MKLMARYTGPVCRLCRREGMKLYLKGDRCYSDKCAIDRRSYVPGQHGQGRKKVSGYGIQLREKQKAKRYYGVMESQFRKYFNMAERMKGVTGENLLSILESRLDNLVYRIGLAESRKEARQLVRHGHFLVNGKKVDIPSYLVKVGDVVEVKESSRSSEKFKGLAENNQRVAPDWLEVDMEKMRARVVGVPKKEHIDIPIEEHLIVELYSR
jgi:small subunit ribosomal protein S4